MAILVFAYRCFHPTVLENSSEADDGSAIIGGDVVVGWWFLARLICWCSGNNAYCHCECPVNNCFNSEFIVASSSCYRVLCHSFWIFGYLKSYFTGVSNSDIVNLRFPSQVNINQTSTTSSCFLFLFFLLLSLPSFFRLSFGFFHFASTPNFVPGLNVKARVKLSADGSRT